MSQKLISTMLSGKVVYSDKALRLLLQILLFVDCPLKALKLADGGQHNAGSEANHALIINIDQSDEAAQSAL